jgi:hypothetical protein
MAAAATKRKDASIDSIAFGIEVSNAKNNDGGAISAMKLGG